MRRLAAIAVLAATCWLLVPACEIHGRGGQVDAPLGLASCWGGDNASERMMNALSPRMPDDVFRARLKFQTSRGCTVSHVFLANGGDGEYAGYAGWRASDAPKMLERVRAIRRAGLDVVPWLVADDSESLSKDFFRHAGERVAALASYGFFNDVPYVVLGLEMDEYGGPSDWARVRDALAPHFDGPVGTHHAAERRFRYAHLGDIVLGQISGATDRRVREQVALIRALGKRAVGFEYSRGPSRALAEAALAEGAEGVGNWDLPQEE